MNALEQALKNVDQMWPFLGASARAELLQLRAFAAEAQAAHVYLDESPVNSPEDPPLELADRVACIVNEVLQLRADLQAAQERIAVQAAIIKEQEQDIANITARESAVVENHRRANAEQARQLEEARVFAEYVSRRTLWTESTLSHSATIWLAANPAPHVHLSGGGKCIICGLPDPSAEPQP